MPDRERDCPDCDGSLDLSQPDATRPRLLLGVCRGCRAWWLLRHRGGDQAPLFARITILAKQQRRPWPRH